MVAWCGNAVKGNMLLKRNMADARAKGLSRGSFGGSVGLAFIGLLGRDQGGFD